MPISLDVVAQLDQGSIRSLARQAGSAMEKAGQEAGDAFGQNFATAASKATDGGKKMEQSFNKAADAAGRLRVEQAKLNALADKGVGGARLAQQTEAVARARRNEAAAVRAATTAYQSLGSAQSSMTRAFGSGIAAGVPFLSSITSDLKQFEGAAGKAGYLAGRALGTAFTVAAGGLIGAAGYTLFKGFERYKVIDESANRLRNLNTTLAATGKATHDVGKVMEVVNQVVLDTPFSLDQAFAVASTALSSSTGDLKRFMTAVADTAGFLNKPIASIGEAFLKVAAEGKVGMEVLTNQLSGLPIEWIAEQLGVTGAELAKMMEKNQVGLETLLQTVEKRIPGMAKGSVDTVTGQLSQMQTAVARLGANFLGAIFGQPAVEGNNFVEILKTVNARINDLGAWVTAHQDDIRNFFQKGAEVAGTLLTVLGNVGNWFVENKQAVYILGTVLGTAFAVSKLSGFITSMQSINTMLAATLPASAAAGASKMMGALGPVAALLTSMHLATGGDPGKYLTPGGDKSAVTRAEEGRWGELFMGDSWNWIKRQFGQDTGQTFGGGGTFPSPPGGQPKMPALPGFGLHWEDGKGWVPDAGPAGSPIQPPPGDSGGGSGSLPEAPQLPLPAEYGQGPRPGESPEQWRQRMDLIEVRHDVAEKQARVNQLEADNNADQNDLTKARNDLIEARMRQTEAEQKLVNQEVKTQLALPAEYGQGPRPGETTEAWRQRMEVIKAQHDVAEKGAVLNQIEQSNTATQNEILSARNDFIEAQAKLNDLYTSNMKQTTSDMGEIGAKLDADFGISRGLAGIAENITKFVGNLIAAPALIQMGKVAQSSTGGHGLLGMLAAQGVFGSLYTQGQQQSGQWYNPDASQYAPSAMGPPQPPTATTTPGQPYGLKAGSAISYGEKGFPDWVYQVAEAFGVKASTYAGHQEGSGLNRGIDWSGSVEDMQRFAEYLSGLGMMEQVIWSNPNTGQKIGVADGEAVGPGTSQPGYYSSDWSGHTDHVHTRQSQSIPLPGQAGYSASQGFSSSGTASYGAGSFPIPLPVTIVGGDGAALPSLGQIPGQPSGLNWDALAQKEASGNWAINTGNGYFGGLQFDQATWNQYKPTGAPGRADLATKEQQIAAGEAAIAARGGPQSLWPQNWGQLGWQGGSSAVPTSPPAPGKPGYTPGVGYVDSQGNPTGYNPGWGGPGLPTQAPSGQAGMFTPGGVAGQAAGSSVIPGRQPSGNPSGQGPGLGGMPMAALSTAAAGLDLLAPGAGQAAQTGIQLINRTIQYGGQLAAIGASGLMETFMLSGGVDPMKSLPGRVIAGLAGARPSLPNTAGQTQQPQGGPQPGGTQHGQAGGAPPGPLMHVENMNVGSAKDGKKVTNDATRQFASAQASGWFGSR